MLGLCVSASIQTEKNIDKLLAPYQAVINKLNTELGATFYIPYENKEAVRYILDFLKTTVSAMQALYCVGGIYNFTNIS